MILDYLHGLSVIEESTGESQGVIFESAALLALKVEEETFCQGKKAAFARWDK